MREVATREEEEEEKQMAKEGERALRGRKKKKKREWQMRVREQRAREGGRKEYLKMGIQTLLLVGTAFVCGIQTRLFPESWVSPYSFQF